MENAFQITYSGQEVQVDDIDQIGATAGLADDHVLAELLRLAPMTGSTVAKAIVTGGLYSSATGTGSGIVQPSGLYDSSVLIFPFRAVVGSRNLANAGGVPSGDITTDSPTLASWRDVRSGVFVGTGTPDAPYSTQYITFSAIATPSNSRWDLVYAAITPDNSSVAMVNRRVKDPTTGVIAVHSVPAYICSPVVVAAVQGVEGTAPTLPALPADGAGTYYIPLAYIRIFTNFSSGSKIAATDIRATTYLVSKFQSVQAGMNLCAAGGNNDANPAFAPGSTFFPWDMSATYGRPGPWLPPEWVGGKSVYAQIDMLGASSTWSHQGTGPTHAVALVDGSIDWRNRIVRVTWAASATEQFATDPTVTTPFRALPSKFDTAATTLSNSFQPDAVYATNSSTIWDNEWSPGNDAALVVSQVDGKLYLCADGLPDARVVFWIDASGQFPNA